MRTPIQEKPWAQLPDPDPAGPYQFQDGTKGVEYTMGPYQVCIRFDWLGAEPKDGATYAMLQIYRSDGGSVFDWRDLQQIKSKIMGSEWEGVELFPAESRLKDPSNARYLWCVSRRLPFGLPGGRVVLDFCESFAPQRGFQSPEAK